MEKYASVIFAHQYSLLTLLQVLIGAMQLVVGWVGAYQALMFGHHLGQVVLDLFDILTRKKEEDEGDESIQRCSTSSEEEKEAIHPLELVSASRNTACPTRWRISNYVQVFGIHIFIVLGGTLLIVVVIVLFSDARAAAACFLAAPVGT